MGSGSDDSLQQIADLLTAARRPLLVGHVRADLDCVGSLSGLALALRENGKHAEVACQRVLVPPRLLLLFEWSSITPMERPDVDGADLVVALDTAVTSRLNIACGYAGLEDKPIAVIDHHVSNEHFGRWNHVNVLASSTCELIYDLLGLLRWPITPMIATMLYSGLHGDTSGFSLPNTTPKSLRVGSELAAAGADIVGICEKVYRSKTPSEFELLRIVYDNTRLSDDGRVAWSTISHEEIIGAGCSHADIDEQVMIPRLLDGAKIAILFSEGLRGSVRVNFRGEGEVDVLGLAREFGGGGHRTSAGTSVKKRPIEEVVREVVERAVAYLAEREGRLRRSGPGSRVPGLDPNGSPDPKPETLDPS